MPETVPIEFVKELLIGQGHTLWNSDDDPHCVVLSPPREIYSTLGLFTDSTLKAAYRDRYFVCNPDPKVMLEFANFPDESSSRWSGMLAGMNKSSSEIVGVLATWTASRIHQSERIFAWTDKPIGIDKEHRSTSYTEVETLLGSM
jgi:hypothetical protein